MPNTGQFFIHSVEGVKDEGGALLQVTHIHCSCLQCHRQFAAIRDHGLLDVDGAAVLICPGCGNRQAICKARLQDSYS